MNLTRYATMVFDCDGVVLDANRVKTEVFFNAALPYGEVAARALVDYHQRHGGVSRYKKFEFFLQHIVGGEVEPAALRALLDHYAHEVRAGLLTCAVAPGLAALRSVTAHSRWLMVSGGDQEELRDVLGRRALDGYFDGGIFGSPDSKDAILARELAASNIVGPAIFFGDSRYDHEAAARAGLDFMFISAWTEFADWERYRRDAGLASVAQLRDLIPEPG